MDEHILVLPKKLRAVVEFQEAAELMSTFADVGHYKESDSLQQHFAKDVTSLLEVMCACGNTFLKESGPDLITLDTKEVMNEESAEGLFNVLENEKELHNSYVRDRLIDGNVAITDTIKGNIVPTFAKPVESENNSSNISMVKRDESLVTQLFADLEELFRHENQKESPALFDQGKLRLGKTSDILACLKIPKVSGPSDLAAIVHMMQPTKASNFAAYVTHHLMPFISSSIQGEV